jgi:hypothetical protein
MSRSGVRFPTPAYPVSQAGPDYMNERLTARSVNGGASDPKCDAFLWDTELKGSGLRVKPSKIAALVIEYRPIG